MDTGTFRYIFGPVSSSRLGRSLGLDLLGARVCSMNCVYCEAGPLERLTLSRAPYVPAHALLAELAAWEAERAERGEPLPDVVTLGGLGEPTLNSGMPQIIAGVRRLLPGVPVAVLTNSSLMTDAGVRAELAQADLVLPSLDSLVPEEFVRVNRGHPALDPKAIADAVLAFRKGYGGRLYLEILLVQGINDSEQNLELLAAYCKHLQPDRVDVVTLSRPGTEAFARAVSPRTLAHWRSRLGGFGLSPGPSASMVAGSPEKEQELSGAMPQDELRARILASLSRRPQTAAQLASAFLAPETAVQRALSELLAQGLADEVRRDGVLTDNRQNENAEGQVYYQVRP